MKEIRKENGQWYRVAEDGRETKTTVFDAQRKLQDDIDLRMIWNESKDMSYDVRFQENDYNEYHIYYDGSYYGGFEKEDIIRILKEYVQKNGSKL
jgi:hypothetical protein